MSASKDDPRLIAVGELLNDIDAWRLKSWDAKSAEVHILAERVLAWMDFSCLDAPLEFRVNRAMNGGVESKDFQIGSPEMDAACLRARATVLEMFGRLAIKSDMIRQTLADDDLRIERGEQPQIGGQILHANRQQDMPKMLDRIKAAAVMIAWWHANYDDEGWEKVFVKLFPGVYAETSLDRVKAALPNDQREAIEEAAKAKRAFDDAVANGRTPTPLTAQQAETAAKVAKHPLPKVRSALRNARANNWRETPKVVQMIKAAGC